MRILFPMRNLARIREQKGVSQVDLAVRCGIATSTLREYEHGRRAVRPHHADALAETLGVTVLELHGLRRVDDLDDDIEDEARPLAAAS